MSPFKSSMLDVQLTLLGCALLHKISFSTLPPIISLLCFVEVPFLFTSAQNSHLVSPSNGKEVQKKQSQNEHVDSNVPCEGVWKFLTREIDVQARAI